MTLGRGILAHSGVIAMLAALALVGCGVPRGGAGSEGGAAIAAGTPAGAVSNPASIASPAVVPERLGPGGARPTSVPFMPPSPTRRATDPVPAEVALTATAIWATNPPPTPRTTDPDVPAAAPASGVPAIRPSRVGDGAGEPTFTEQDVRDYLQRHPISVRGLRATGPVVVERVEFVLGQTLGSPDYPLLCVVTVRGDFHLIGGPAPAPGATPGPPARYDRVTQIFDAHTGNLLGSNASLVGTPAN